MPQEYRFELPHFEKKRKYIQISKLNGYVTLPHFNFDSIVPVLVRVLAFCFLIRIEKIFKSNSIQ